MQDAAVSQVRSFNRLVTQRVGALNDHYLSRSRPLGEARVLWEIGVDGCDVRARLPLGRAREAVNSLGTFAAPLWMMGRAEAAAAQAAAPAPAPVPQPQGGR